MPEEKPKFTIACHRCKKKVKCHTSNRKFCVDCIGEKALESAKLYQKKAKQQPASDLIHLDETKTFSTEQERMIRYLVEAKRRENESMWVIYTPDCQCSIEQFVMLDRYPMSPKIHGMCPECKKYCLMEISDPIRFHLPLTNQDYVLEDFKDMQIMPSPQEHYLRMYKFEALGF